MRSYGHPNGIDLKIMGLLLANMQQSRISSKQISKELGIPLSTIQRRLRRIMTSGIVKHRYELDFSKLGLKRGLIHIYHGNGKNELYDMADQVSRIGDGLMSISIHLGNSDIVCEYAYRDSRQLVEILSKIKGIGGVKEVKWSEQVYQIPLQG